MSLRLVSPEELPPLQEWFHDTFGAAPTAILLFPGTEGSGWHDATFRGAVFQQFDPSKGFIDAVERRELSKFFPDAPLRFLDVTFGHPQNEHVVPFVEGELLPALADAVGGVIVSSEGVLYTGNREEAPERSFERFQALHDERVRIRSRPPSDSEDWSDL